MQRCDVVIVGGGIGGGALATALAGDGLDVIVLEASEVYEDRVRGESMLPWGVKEAKELGVEPALLEAGAKVAGTWFHYDQDTPTDIIDRLNQGIGAQLADPKLITQLADIGVVPMRMTPGEFKTFIVTETEKWAKVVKFANIKAD